MTGARYRFGPFQMDVPHLALTRDGVPLKLGGRALNLLAVLVEAEGQLVARDALIDRVWPNQAIDDSAIRVHLSAARKALAMPDGEATIVADAGRGYRLALPVERLGGEDIPASVERRISRLPASIGRIFGREDVIATIAGGLAERRFISIVGPGGIGKTTAATAIGHRLVQTMGIEAWFVDLAPVTDATMVVATLATTLELPASGTDLPQRIAARLAERPSLILLDNCEHVIDAATSLAEAVLHGAPQAMLLVTSHEPLRAQGEWVHRLAALELPDEHATTSLEQVALLSAPALFEERARAANGDFRLDAQSVPVVVDICRKLDGIPLAIELAAARIDTMTPQAIADALDDRFALLTRGRRTALPRHRTLRGALDWSYDLLAPPLQKLLDRLALFRSRFDAEDAAAMAAGAGVSPFAADDLLAELVAKSLVVATPSPGSMRYRLLDTTRHYGQERLRATGMAEQAHRDHAHVLLRGLADSATAWEGKAPREWLAEYSVRIDDVRSAIAWASAGKDAGLAAELVIAAAPLWFHLSLPAEFLRYAEAVIANMAEGQVEPARQVELLTAYGHGLWHTEGPVPAMADAFARALTLAEEVGSAPLALRALWGVWAQSILAGRYEESLVFARRFDARVGAGGALADRQTAAHMLALSLHFSGDHAGSRRMLEVVMAGDAAPERANHANHAQVDGKIAVLSLLMRLHWAEGDLTTAMALARDCAEDAERIDHALSVCYGLAVGCIPVAIAAGQRELAAEWITALTRRTTRHGLDHWHSFVAGYGQALDPAARAPHRVSGMQAKMYAVAAGGGGDVPWRREGA
jgi:predicted ATPase/DNA-binding winged helix-turn-helix (wHTH) protein